MIFNKDYSEAISDEVVAETIDIINKYFSTNKCCENYPKCLHPKQQTDTKLFNVDNKSIKVMKNTFYDAVKLFYPNTFEVIYEKAWGYFANDLPELTWHNHITEPENGDTFSAEISGILYLTKTDRRTIFDTKNFTILTKPKLKTWYIWPSELQHTPQIGKTDDVRYVIATSIGVKINGK